jgi:hypothetical protein
VSKFVSIRGELAAYEELKESELPLRAKVACAVVDLIERCGYEEAIVNLLKKAGIDIDDYSDDD